MNKRIAVIPGDGIGIEVTAEALKVLERLKGSRGLPLEWVTFDWGAEKFLREGVSLPEGALEMLRRDFHAIFIGAVGDPR
ncbi:MAG: 3-isopropylmalate dehydrogenase, partial [Acidobacteria bacterium]|nr:3-isopropylmalate dehydrogenase [Acidobacteriota bacterium]